MGAPRIIKGRVAEIVCHLSSQCFSPRQISKALSEEAVVVSHSAINNFLKKEENQTIIREKKDFWRSDPLRVDIAHKTTRLEDLNRERISIIRTLRTFKDKKGLIAKKKLQSYLSLTKRLLEFELAGREEVERKPDMVALFQRMGPFKGVSDDALHKELREIDGQLRVIRDKDTCTAAVGSQSGDQVTNSD